MILLLLHCAPPPPPPLKITKATTMKPSGHMVCLKLSPLRFAQWKDDVI